MITSAPQNDTPVDVVVCTQSHQRLLLLEECVAAILAELALGQLFVVVDHNELLLDELGELYGEIDRVTVLANASERGLSGSRNTGLSTGDSPIVCFIDDDAVLRPGWYRALANAFSEKRLIGVGGLVSARFLTENHTPRSQPRWMPKAQYWALGCDYPQLPKPGAEIRNPIGAAMALRRKVLTRDSSQEFSSALGRVGEGTAGGEETELFLRLRRDLPDGIVRRISGFHVDHAVLPSRTRLSYLLRRAFGEGRSKAALSGLPHTDFSSERGHLWQTVASLNPVGLVMLLATGLGFLSGRQLCVSSGTDSSGHRPLMSVIVCTDAKGNYLADTVSSVLVNHSGPELELIIVDNSTHTGTVEKLLAPTLLLDDPRVRVVHAPEPGLSRARNVGVNAACSEILAFTDDDATVAKDWSRRIWDSFDQDTWCVTGRTTGLTTESGTGLWFEQSGGFDKGEQRRVWRLDSPEVPALFPYPAGCFGSGNNMAFRKQALIRIGGFAEELGAGRATRGGEDLDAFRSIILAGGSIVYEPQAHVVHRHRATSAALHRQMYGYGTGMAASLGRCLLDSPTHSLAILAGVPRGVRIFLDRRVHGRSPVHDRPPASLIAVEAAGYLTGFPLLLAVLVRDSYQAIKA
ncbi:glycosyltransferase [Corynebacterium alimapuense]|uniref:Glycosyl transferase n=1 Tax=Corynebacterium alimapuense TaxID=1576874 RepID=A0A3M8KBT0_9CORY|nr:glycosyltransferase [Corynebacterium alimapuense]RNE50024.1 glycosyl transferase [Corynebacterium alimapuense]